MRRRAAIAAAAGVALCAAGLAAQSAAASSTSGSPKSSGTPKYGLWTDAQEVPGTDTLNVGGAAGVNSVSCPAGGTCAAGGSYTDSSKFSQAFVTNENGGKWSNAAEVPGTAALNAGGDAATVSVSCAAPGDCDAGGYYADSSDDWQSFVVEESGGTWGTAAELPGTAALNAGGHSEIESMSCPAAGQCSAAGIYTDGSGDQQAFVDTETDGVWGTAAEVSGLGALNVGGRAAITTLSCDAVGDCGAGGYYSSSNVDGITNEQAFVVNETGGTWGTAQEVPGTASLNAGGFAEVNSVSCTGVGDCSAGGLYINSTPATEAFVVDESGGTWGTAQELPGISDLNTTGFAQVNSVSCTSPGNCLAGGYYQDSNYIFQSFLVSESGSVWGNAEETPGTAALNSLGASTSAVSCGGPGNCSAAGYYTTSVDEQQVFVISESSGVWDSAVEIPRTAGLNTGGKATVNSLSCSSTNMCSAGGHYTIHHLASTEAYVVHETKGG
jgi:hypothetical protein